MLIITRVRTLYAVSFNVRKTWQIHNKGKAVDRKMVVVRKDLETWSKKVNIHTKCTRVMVRWLWLGANADEMIYLSNNLKPKQLLHISLHPFWQRCEPAFVNWLLKIVGLLWDSCWVILTDTSDSIRKLYWFPCYTYLVSSKILIWYCLNLLIFCFFSCFMRIPYQKHCSTQTQYYVYDDFKPLRSLIFSDKQVSNSVDL